LGTQKSIGVKKKKEKKPDNQMRRNNISVVSLIKN